MELKPHPKNICIVGTGYVGLVAAACFAEMGHQVVCLDIDADKIRKLQGGDVPFYEPGMEQLLHKQENWSRLRFTTDYAEAASGQDFIFIAVNTPPLANGQPSLSQITDVARSLASCIERNTVVVNKSTGPVGMAGLIRRILAEYSPYSDIPVVANPEFLQEGNGVFDFMHPFQVVIGSWDKDAGYAVGKLYEPLGRPMAYCDPPTAEMTKLVSNAFRAVKISFINEIAAICDRLQVDVGKVSEVIGADKAIGPSFLKAGVGWGGNCLPKDILTLQSVAESCGVQPRMLRSASQINQAQRAAVVEKLRSMLGKLSNRNIGVLGLAYKAGTDDVRMSPAVEVVQLLLQEHCTVRAYDPMAMEPARALLKGVTLCSDAYEAAQDSDALVLLTDWPEFKTLDLHELRRLTARPYFVDGRNIFDPVAMEAAGFVYAGLGHGYPKDHISAREQSTLEVGASGAPLHD